MQPALLFFGTEHFGAAMLEALIQCNAYNIVGVVTQPDRPVGRKQELSASPVKEIALKYGLRIFQPDSLKNWKLEIGNWDFSIVCQYGLIIPQSILDLPKQGTLNIHTSLLPKYRGASPIQTALLNGETETGVTLMLMDAKMDHGPILAQEKIAINPDDTAETLSTKMMPLAAEVLLTNLPLFLAGKLTARPQDETKVTLCKLLSREDGKINFTQTAQTIYNQYRGLTPWPGVWTMWEGKRLKLLKIKPNKQTLKPGQVMVEKDSLLVGAGKDSIEILELQLEGKKPLSAKAFVAGNAAIDHAKVG